jgi:hypothetical protein
VVGSGTPVAVVVGRDMTAEDRHTQPCMLAPPNDKVRRHSGVQRAVWVEPNDPASLAEQQIRGLQQAREQIEEQEAIAEILVDEVRRLQDRVHELERMAATQQQAHDLELHRLGAKFRAAVRQLRRSYVERLQQQRG